MQDAMFLLFFLCAFCSSIAFLHTIVRIPSLIVDV
jgi:hypothetical protein